MEVVEVSHQGTLDNEEKDWGSEFSVHAQATANVTESLCNLLANTFIEVN